MAIPFDGSAMERLYEYIVRGLVWHHWKVLLGHDVLVKAGFLVDVGRRMFEHLLMLEAAERVSVNLGDGVFVYEGAQAKDCPEFTVWRMSFYGGAILKGASNDPLNNCTTAYGITAPKRWPVSQQLLVQLGA